MVGLEFLLPRSTFRFLLAFMGGIDLLPGDFWITYETYQMKPIHQPRSSNSTFRKVVKVVIICSNLVVC